MSSAEIKASIKEMIDNLDDSFLKVVHTMLGAYVEEQKGDPIVGYDIDGTPRTASELTEILDKEMEQVNQGNYKTIDQLSEESAKWIQPIK